MRAKLASHSVVREGTVGRDKTSILYVGADALTEFFDPLPKAATAMGMGIR